MSALHTILLFLAAFLGVYAQAAFPVVRHLLGAQVDILPALMVYAALHTSLNVVCLLALVGGLLFDSLSANPLGVSILPLFAVGCVIWLRRELILRDQVFAQIVLGFAASAVVPVTCVLLILTAGQSPLLGWGSLWQWLVMTVGGGLAAPLIFLLFGWFNRTFGYQPVPETSFRPDREIRRGRL